VDEQMSGIPFDAHLSAHPLNPTTIAIFLETRKRNTVDALRLSGVARSVLTGATVRGASIGPWTVEVGGATPRRWDESRPCLRRFVDVDFSSGISSNATGGESEGWLPDRPRQEADRRASSEAERLPQERRRGCLGRGPEDLEWLPVRGSPALWALLPARGESLPRATNTTTSS